MESHKSLDVAVEIEVSLNHRVAIHVAVLLVSAADDTHSVGDEVGHVGDASLFEGGAVARFV